MIRKLLILAFPLALTACANMQQRPNGALARIDPAYAKMYGEVKNEPYPIPAVDLQQIKPQFLRKEVVFDKKYAPGTVIVDTQAHYAYYILPDHKAVRYGVGVAKHKGANLIGQSVIGRKAEWPSWVPTKNMMRTQPERYGKMGRGLPPGITSPLGARALYLYRNGKDTYYRLHGTIEPYTIGTDVSSGCIRFLNQDIIDLYSRVKPGAKVVVME